MKHKTSELDGELLDAAVAKAEGFDHPDAARVEGEDGALRPFEPSSVWNDGGPIIDREKIAVGPNDKGGWVAYVDAAIASCGSDDCVFGNPAEDGPTPLIAAMRAYVTSKLGYEVEL